MRDRKDIMFEHPAHSRAFLKRAKLNLKKFDDNSDVSGIFYACLDLRFGIEARIFEYIDATFKSQKMDPSKVNDYVASKLLRKLITADPDADKRVTLKMTSEQTGAGSSLLYTPVTAELAKMHGRLGELLHFKFFRNNKYWNLRTRLDGESNKTLIDYREFLDDVVNELEQATKGTLLSSAKFTTLVNEVIAEDSGE